MISNMAIKKLPQYKEVKNRMKFRLTSSTGWSNPQFLES